jgi:predicted aldo/keto reductase-like oxidoreductase
MGRIALSSWIITIALACFGLGGLVGRLAEGYDRAQLSMLPVMATGLALLASVVCTIVWLRHPDATTPSASGEPGRPRSGRRVFLLGALSTLGGLAGTLAAVVAPNRRWFSVTGQNIFMVRPEYKASEYHDEWSDARVVEYRRLGRTEARVSDISLGSGSSTGGRQTLEVAHEAIERGINYFDTAPDYSETGSELRLGAAMKGARERMFVATKFCRPTGHLGPGNSVEEYMEAVNGSLRRLQTDWVDLVHIHSCDSVERLMDENVHEAFDRLKEQGKVRFLGVSTHTPNLEAVANAAIDSDRFDAMMLAYHFGAWPNLASIIDRAAQQDIGVVAMKVLRGSMHKQLHWSRDERDSFTQASFKWVLSNPSVACLVISLWSSEQLDEFLFASGKRPEAIDIAVLERYEQLTRGTHCRPHCGACLSRCPEQLPIHDVLRQRMYVENFGAQKEAMQLYSALDKQADVCASCSAPCLGACPDGIPIAQRMREAHEILHIA